VVGPGAPSIGGGGARAAPTPTSPGVGRWRSRREERAKLCSMEGGARVVAHGAEWYRGGGARRRALLFLDELDLSPDNNGGLMQSERPLEMVCRKHHQLLDHSRLSRRLGESDAPFGYLSVVSEVSILKEWLQSWVRATKTVEDGLNSIIGSMLRRTSRVV
jgi:hypothetical protein